MNREINKKIIEYRKTLEDKKVNTAIYSFFLMMAIFVYGFFGLFTFYKALREKYQTYKDLTQLNINLSNKLRSLAQVRHNLAEAEPYLVGLKGAVTLVPEVENYMVALVNAAAGAGYVQHNMFLQAEEPQVTTLRMTFEGPAANFGVFVNAIESLPRISVITSASYSIRDELAYVSLTLQIFHMQLKL